MFILAGNAILTILLVYSGISNFSKSEEKVIPEGLTQVTKNIPTNTPTVKPTNTPTPILNRTLTPSPTPILTETPTNTPIPEKETNESNVPSNTTGNVGLTLMNQINDFRSSKGLAPLSTDGYTCAFASLRAGEIVSGFNHDGFRSRIDASSLPYPSYSSVAENIAMNSDSNAVVQGWIDSPGHNENMSKNVAYGCVGVSGNYYVFEAWQP